MISFEPKAQGFSPANAWVLAQIATLAYQSGFDVAYDAEHTWRMEYAYLENMEHDTQFLVMGDAEKVIVAFRGTEDTDQDWNINARYHFSSALNGRVHDGFWLSAQSIMGDLASTLDRFCTQGQTVWLTGHSLGGALAMLVTAYFVSQGIKPAGLYTFGQPRVGDSMFAYHFNEQYNEAYRLVNEGDVTVCIPPHHLGYDHAGKFYHLLEAGGYSQDLQAWSSYWGSDAKVIDDFLELAIFGSEEHGMAEYSTRLLKMACAS